MRTKKESLRILLFAILIFMAYGWAGTADFNNLTDTYSTDKLSTVEGGLYEK
jgi:hypothetical protein